MPLTYPLPIIQRASPKNNRITGKPAAAAELITLMSGRRVYEGVTTLMTEHSMTVFLDEGQDLRIGTPVEITIGGETKDRGPYYGHGQILTEGLPDAADSLAAIRHFVFGPSEQHHQAYRTAGLISLFSQKKTGFPQ